MKREGEVEKQVPVKETVQVTLCLCVHFADKVDSLAKSDEAQFRRHLGPLFNAVCRPFC